MKYKSWHENIDKNSEFVSLCALAFSTFFTVDLDLNQSMDDHVGLTDGSSIAYKFRLLKYCFLFILNNSICKSVEFPFFLDFLQIFDFSSNSINLFHLVSYLF